MVEDREPFTEPQGLGFLSNEANAEAVKGRKPDVVRRVVSDASTDALAHLVSRLVGERHREDRARVNARREQSGDSRGDHAGLPRSSSRENQQGPLPVLDRRALLWIQSQGSAK